MVGTDSLDALESLAVRGESALAVAQAPSASAAAAARKLRNGFLLPFGVNAGGLVLCQFAFSGEA